MRPIGRKRNNNSYTVDDFYESYITHTDNSPAFYVKRGLYRLIVEDYFKYIYSSISKNAMEIKLPARMGDLCVIKKKPTVCSGKYLRTDFKATKEEGYRVVHMNEHSDGYNIKFKWTKASMIVPNRNLYQLVMSRANKRSLAQIIKNKEQDFIEK